MTFETFEPKLQRLVAKFEKQFDEFTSPGYQEAQLRDDFLNPFFRALGWDMENESGHIQKEREVEIESRTDIAGKAKRADYLFRTDGNARFICEAKKPREILGPKYAFQAKRYAWNKTLPLAILSDFEEIKIYVVGGKPHADRPDEGLWKTWHFKQFPAVAREIWNLLSRPSVAAGSIDALLDSLPKRAPTGRGKAKQLYLIKPDRTRALDTEFLGFLDEARRSLGSDLVKHNPDANIRDVSRLTEAVQHILDRLLFLRICEDRDIDTGMRLDSIVQTWRRSYHRDDTKRYKQGFPMFDGDGVEESASSRLTDDSRDSLWDAIVRHFRALDRRPASHVPFFNGHLFKPHFTESLLVGDQWLCDFIEYLSDDETPYLFNIIEVEMLGNVYERFLGKIVRPQGRGVTIEEKPEVRKAGGVYYTPRYIVEYIVEQTVGRLLDPILDVKTFAAFEKQTHALRLLDPACGSGSFLIRCFERVCEHWQRRLTRNPDERRKELCWVDPVTKDVHLSVELKRQILRSNIYGVDIDAQAVEVTQLSLYLKMLENENRTTLQRQRELFSKDTALLPPLENNIKSGNSLIASDFSLDPDDLVRVRAFDWPVQFREIMKGGGFDAVVGNPPYVYGRDWAGLGIGDDQKRYFGTNYSASPYQLDLFSLFMERAIFLTKNGGATAQIVPNVWLTNSYSKTTRAFIFSSLGKLVLTAAPSNVFEGIVVDTVIYAGRKGVQGTVFDLARISGDAVTSIGRFPCADYSDGGTPITTNASSASIELTRKSIRNHVLLGSITEMTRGVHPYRADGFGESAFSNGVQTQRDVAERPYHSKISKPGWIPFIYGKDLHRLAPPISTEFVWYGKWLAEPRHPRFFTGPRIYSRKILGERLVVTYEENDTVADQQVYITKPIDVTFSVKYLTGILGSRFVAFFIRAYFDECTKAFPQIKVSQLREIPIAKPDRARHDAIVGLVDKMLVLTPKLRAAATDKERSILQNAVTATDQQIDQLVYKLYGLTPEEIALVEGGYQA